MSLESKLKDIDINSFDLTDEQILEFMDVHSLLIPDVMSYNEFEWVGDTQVDNQDVFLYLKDIISTPFPDGLKSVPNEFYLYRYLFIPKRKSLNKKQLGRHWTTNKKLMTNQNFISYLYELHKNGLGAGIKDVKRVIIVAKYSLTDIDKERTMIARMTYPEEGEMTLKIHAKPTEAYVQWVEPNQNRVEMEPSKMIKLI